MANMLKLKYKSLWKSVDSDIRMEVLYESLKVKVLLSRDSIEQKPLRCTTKKLEDDVDEKDYSDHEDDYLDFSRCYCSLQRQKHFHCFDENCPVVLFAQEEIIAHANRMHGSLGRCKCGKYFRTNDLCFTHVMARTDRDGHGFDVSHDDTKVRKTSPKSANAFMHRLPVFGEDFQPAHVTNFSYVNSKRFFHFHLCECNSAYKHIHCPMLKATCTFIATGRNSIKILLNHLVNKHQRKLLFPCDCGVKLATIAELSNHFVAAKNKAGHAVTIPKRKMEEMGYNRRKLALKKINADIDGVEVQREKSHVEQKCEKLDQNKNEVKKDKASLAKDNVNNQKVKAKRVAKKSCAGRPKEVSTDIDKVEVNYSKVAKKSTAGALSKRKGVFLGPRCAKQRYLNKVGNEKMEGSQNYSAEKLERVLPAFTGVKRKLDFDFGANNSNDKIEKTHINDKFQKKICLKSCKQSKGRDLQSENSTEVKRKNRSTRPSARSKRTDAKKFIADDEEQNKLSTPAVKPALEQSESKSSLLQKRKKAFVGPLSAKKRFENRTCRRTAEETANISNGVESDKSDMAAYFSEKRRENQIEKKHGHGAEVSNAATTEMRENRAGNCRGSLSNSLLSFKDNEQQHKDDVVLSSESFEETDGESLVSEDSAQIEASKDEADDVEGLDSKNKYEKSRNSFTKSFQLERVEEIEHTSLTTDFLNEVVFPVANKQADMSFELEMNSLQSVDSLDFKTTDDLEIEGENANTGDTDSESTVHYDSNAEGYNSNEDEVQRSRVNSPALNSFRFVDWATLDPPIYSHPKAVQQRLVRLMVRHEQERQNSLHRCYKQLKQVMHDLSMDVDEHSLDSEDNSTESVACNLNLTNVVAPDTDLPDASNGQVATDNDVGKNVELKSDSESSSESEAIISFSEEMDAVTNLACNAPADNEIDKESIASESFCHSITFEPCSCLGEAKHFHCHHCDFTALRQMLIKKHVEMKHKTLIKKCTKCGNLFSKFAFKQHSKTCQGRVNDSDDIRQGQNSTLPLQEGEIATDNNAKTLEECQSAINQLLSLDQLTDAQLLEALGERAAYRKCNVCNVFVTEKNNLFSAHRLLHTNSGLQCHCGRLFQMKNDFIGHIFQHRHQP